MPKPQKRAIEVDLTGEWLGQKSVCGTNYGGAPVRYELEVEFKKSNFTINVFMHTDEARVMRGTGTGQIIFLKEQMVFLGRDYRMKISYKKADNSFSGKIFGPYNNGCEITIVRR